MYTTHRLSKKSLILLASTISALATQDVFACLHPIIKPAPEYSIRLQAFGAEAKIYKTDQGISTDTTLNPETLQILQSEDRLNPSVFVKDNQLAYLNDIELIGTFDIASLTPVSYSIKGQTFSWVIFKDKSNWYFKQPADQSMKTMRLTAFSSVRPNHNFDASLSQNQRILYLIDQADDLRYSVHAQGSFFAQWPGKASEWQEAPYSSFNYQQHVYLQTPKNATNEWPSIAGLYLAGTEATAIGAMYRSQSYCGPVFHTFSPIYSINKQIYILDNTTTTPSMIGAASNDPKSDTLATLSYLQKNHHVVPLPEILKNDSSSHFNLSSNIHHQNTNIRIYDQTLELHHEDKIKEHLKTPTP